MEKNTGISRSLDDGLFRDTRGGSFSSLTKTIAIKRKNSLERYSEDIELAHLTKCLEHNRLNEILKSGELFKQLFCHAVCKGNVAFNSVAFHIKRQPGNVLKVVGTKETVNSIFDTVNKIRKYLSKAFQQEISGVFYVALISEKTDLSDTFEAVMYKMNNFHKAEDSAYPSYIQPVMPQLARELGAGLEHFQENFKKYEVKGIRLNWGANAWSSFIIPPKCLDPQQPINEKLYQLYKKRQGCYLTLVSEKDKLTENVHSSVIMCNAGSLGTDLLHKGNASDGSSDRLNINCSSAVLRVFALYCYIGERAFIESNLKARFQRDLGAYDVTELMGLAHEYAMLHLFDCCVTQINSIASKDDIGTVQGLAEKYNNPYLKEVLEALKRGERVPSRASKVSGSSEEPLSSIGGGSTSSKLSMIDEKEESGPVNDKKGQQSE